MAKKRKTPTKNRLTTRTTSAPMIVRASTHDANAPAAPLVVEALPAAPMAAAVTIDHDVIARVAFSKFVARGYVHGYALEDWLAAEAELRAASSASVAKA